MTPIVPALPETDLNFLCSAAAAATAGGCIWPDFVACEAALESGYGTDTLAREDNNLFGMKQHKHPIFGTVTLPTREFMDGKWIPVSAQWVKYPALSDCFADRMATLRRLAPEYQHYAAAIAAHDGGTFIREVSKTWSTDPDRAQKVLNIYARWKNE
ncbi:MAG TPA: glucosaminidase domain-containing protein [Candidatus Angelobacter sp.]|jgi:flagellum-specific peptidoglycan hydrolase FlgJ